MTNPTEPTDGYGELIRAQRLYMGLSQRELARTVPMDRRTYQRIENGTVPCPVGFLDTMIKLVDTFDTEVWQTVQTAEKMAGSKSAGSVHFNVRTDEDSAHVWTRAVIGRAAVESGLIVPEARPEELVTTHAGRLANT
jgi:transcriptional regulator with XRE-family HTH domain